MIKNILNIKRIIFKLLIILFFAQPLLGMEEQKTEKKSRKHHKHVSREERETRKQLEKMGYTKEQVELFFSEKTVELEIKEIKEIIWDNPDNKILEFNVFEKFENLSKLYQLTEYLKIVSSGGEKNIYAGLFNGQECVYLIYKQDKQLKDTLESRFNSEVNMLTELQGCENIIKLLGYDQKNKIIVLEKCKYNLKDYIYKNMSTITVEQQQSLIKNMLNGIKEMHDRNIIHNDIKPDNMVLNDDLKIKFIDFGFACKLDENKDFCNLTKPVGSHFYLAPEYYSYVGFTESKNDFDDGYKYYKSGDIYSLGWVIYFVISGKSVTDLFKNSFPEMARVFNEGYEFVDELEKIDNEFGNNILEQIVKPCLNLNSEDRPTIYKIIEIFKDINSSED
ncbi:MAG: hypothetical protein SZ59_C0002G0170 [candidate division TM6 bacterium GW2011_GWF2_28_16]|nr:MAG: hypothetical protein SZ59_C0002G0170 [candidate division TM6 bacterium GW2011_GWF2_28_16]